MDNHPSRVAQASAPRSQKRKTTKQFLHSWRRRTKLQLSLKKALLTSLGFDPDVTLAPEQFEAMLSEYRGMAFCSTTAEAFASSYLLSEFLSQWDGWGLVSSSDEMRERNALSVFFEGEENCRDVNWRFCEWESSAGVKYPEVIRRARKIVKKVLGPCNLDELPRSCGFGPGATSELKREVSSHQYKWSFGSHITVRCLPYWRAFIQWAGLDLLEREVTVVRANVLQMVPKKWKTFRTIAMPVTLNSFFQHGFGKMIRRRLQRFGLLHKDAQLEHGYLAYWASLHKHLATLDVKNASGSVSYGIVRALLPDDWFEHLNNVREHYGSLNGAEFEYAQFSSMGNGFTFELETLIFYALVTAVVGWDKRHMVSVYGDDIICPCKAVPEVTAVLTDCGMRLNSDKSFTGEHPFRESCGYHWFNGVDVKPFRLKHELVYFSDVCNAANSALAWSMKFHAPELRAFWQYVYRLTPEGLRGCMAGDGHLNVPLAAGCKKFYSKRYQCFEHDTITRVPRWFDFSDWSGGYLHKLWVENDAYDESQISSRLNRASSKEAVAKICIDLCAWDNALPTHI